MPLEIRPDVLQGWSLVVVDDDPDSLDVAVLLLEFYGATVHTATNGIEGVELIKRIRPRFVIADISMPMLDGWGLIEQLKADSHTVNIPVIALTAHAMHGHRERAMEKGFYNYLTKPLTPDTFMHHLMILLLDVPEFALELRPT